MKFEAGQFYNKIGTSYRDLETVIEVIKVISVSKNEARLRGRCWIAPFQMYPFLRYLEEKVFLVTPENWRIVDFDELEYYKWRT